MGVAKAVSLIAVKVLSDPVLERFMTCKAIQQHSEAQLIRVLVAQHSRVELDLRSSPVQRPSLRGDNVFGRLNLDRS